MEEIFIVNCNSFNNSVFAFGVLFYVEFKFFYNF